MGSARGSRTPSAVVPAAAPVLIAIAGITYTSWVLQFALNPRLDPVNGYVSELSASDQPFHYLFAGGDFISGTLTIIVACMMLPRLRPRGWARTGLLALVAFGFFAICDALFAMDCAPNSDTTCALRERAEKVSFSHQFHSVTSVCVVMAGIVSLLAFTLAARRRGGWQVVARWGWPLVIAETGTAVATLPLMYFGVLLGIMERVQVTVISLWLLVLAGELYAARRRSLSVPAGPAARRAGARDAVVVLDSGAVMPVEEAIDPEKFSTAIPVEDALGPQRTARTVPVEEALAPERITRPVPVEDALGPDTLTVRTTPADDAFAAKSPPEDPHRVGRHKAANT